MSPELRAADEEVLVEETAGPSASTTAASLTVLPLGPETPPGTDLAEVLDTAAGTAVRRLGGLGDYAGLSIRGSSFRQVEVFLDGVPLNPDGSHAVDLSEFPVQNLDRVELYRGFAPPAFASSAMGGVVNLVTADAARVPASLTVAGGSWGTLRTSGLLAGGRGGADVLLAADHLHTEGDWPYFDDQGTEFNRLDDRTYRREHNAVDRASVLGRVRFGPAAARVTVLDAFSRLGQELTGPISDPAALAAWTSTRNLLVARMDARPAPGWRLDPRAWWHVQEQVVDDRGGEIGVGPDWTRAAFGTLGAQLGADRALGSWLVASAVVRGRWDRFRPEDLLRDQTDGTRARLAGTAALSATARAWADRVALTPVLQVEGLDNRHLGEVPFEDTPVAPEGEDRLVRLLPRAGALLRPVPEVALRANVGAYHRPPDFTELFGSQGNLVGNTGLVPEHGWSWDVGARLHTPAVGRWCAALDVDYARNRVHDLITWVPNSQQTQQAQNLGEAYVRSVETAATVDALGVLTSTTSATWTLSRNLDPDPTYANRQLPQVPPVEVSQRTELRWRDRVSVAHTFSYTAPTWLDAANTQLTAARALHGLAAAVTPVAGLPTVRAEVLNLLDVRGMAMDRNPFDPADDTLVVKPLVDFGGYPLPGRTVMVAVSWQPPRPE